MVCIAALDDPQLGDTYAMAIGDAFTFEDLSAFEWASFAKAAGLPGALVGRQLKLLAERVLAALPHIGDSVMPDGVKGRLCEVIRRNCKRQLAVADGVKRVRVEDL